MKRILAPVRACLSTARQEGLIRHNPADGATLPNRETVRTVEDEDAGDARAFSRGQLGTVLRVVHKDHRALFHLLAGTGLRWGEAAALRRGDIILDGSAPCVRVRRALGKATQRDRERAAATGAKLEPRFKLPKTDHGKRDVPLSPGLVDILRAHLRSLRPDDAESLAFPSEAGTPLRHENVRRRRLHPATSEAGAEWAGFHAFRHTFASLHIDAGTNVLVLSRLLGHHSPEFTLRVYAHLIPGDAIPALDLAAELAGQGDNNMTTDLPGTDPTEPEPIAAGPTV